MSQMPCTTVQGIPGSVLANMDRVRILDVSQNRFEELPASIDGMEHLERLIAASNVIANIDCQLGQLRKLKVCCLRLSVCSFDRWCAGSSLTM